MWKRVLTILSKLGSLLVNAALQIWSCRGRTPFFKIMWLNLLMQSFTVFHQEFNVLIVSLLGSRGLWVVQPSFLWNLLELFDCILTQWVMKKLYTRCHGLWDVKQLFSLNKSSEFLVQSIWTLEEGVSTLPYHGAYLNGLSRTLNPRWKESVLPHSWDSLLLRLFLLRSWSLPWLWSLRICPCFCEQSLFQLCCCRLLVWLPSGLWGERS